MPTADVALVSARAARSTDDDLPLLADALRARGVSADVTIWDDASVDWASYRLAVVRSTWDYALRRHEFLAWADGVAGSTRLFNPPDVLRWNTDKRYLRELEAASAPVVPTTWLEPGDAPRLPDGRDVVIKPAVSAGALDTARYGATHHAAALAHANALLAAGRAVMVQPYVTAIDEAGETGLVYCRGEFSHAFGKAPILRSRVSLVDGLYAEERITPRTPSASEMALAERVLDAVPGGSERLLYARVDVVPGEHGEPLLLELEVTEPSLFLHCGSGSADRFAAAMEAALR